MKRSDVKPLFKKNISLALKLALLDDKSLSHITVIDPDGTEIDPAVKAKYDSFCAKLTIHKKPILVIEDDGHEGFMKKVAKGAYCPTGNYIFLKRGVYEGMARSDPHSDYVPAHEIGHAADEMSRRRFLRYGVNAIALGVGYGAYEATDYIAREKKFNDTSAKILGISVGASTAIAAHEIGQRALVRGSEFAADRYATFLLGYRESIDAIYHFISSKNKTHYEQLRPEYNALMQEYTKQNGIHLSEKEIEFGFKVFISQQMITVHSLRDIIKTGAYPSTLERIQRIIHDNNSQDSLSKF